MPITASDLRSNLQKLWDLDAEVHRIQAEVKTAIANPLGLHVDQIAIVKGRIIINPFRPTNHAKVERHLAKVPIPKKTPRYDASDGLVNVYRGDDGLGIDP